MLTVTPTRAHYLQTGIYTGSNNLMTRSRLETNSGLNFVKVPEGHKDTIHHITGILQLTRFSVSLHGPECIVNATWYSRTNLTSFPVTIDVCPAIAADCASDILYEKDALFSSAYKSVLQNVRSYLVPSDGRSCNFSFKLVFADTHRSSVTGLTVLHTKCFRVLKTLFKALCQVYPILAYRHCHEQIAFAALTDLSFFALCIMGFSQLWLNMADKEIKVHRREIRMIFPMTQSEKRQVSTESTAFLRN